MGSSVDSKNAQRLKGFKYVGALADGQVWKFDNASGNMIPGSDGNSTNLSEGTSTTTTVDVDSDTGTNATLVAASTIRAGVMTKAKFDEVVLNNAKVTFPEAPNDGTQYARKNLGWEAVGAASGPFALFDSAGVPTFYTTLALVITAASAGDTIEQFADVVETVASNALPANVNWNLNGHTYEKTAGSYAISIPASSTSKVTNGRIFANGSGNCIDMPLSNQNFYWDGLVLESTLEITRGGTASHVYNATFITTSNTLAGLNNGNYHNCIIRSTGTATAVSSCQDLLDCNILATGGYAIENLLGTAIDCIIISTGGTAIRPTNFKGIRCFIKSTALHGINITDLQLDDCTVISTAGTGITCNSATSKIKNCTVSGVTASFAIRTVNTTIKIDGCTITNSAGRGVELGANAELTNSTVRITYDNAAGDAILVQTGLTAGNEPAITNCTLQITNAGANFLLSSNIATRANYANNSLISQNVITTPISATVTQGIIAAADNQGNINF